MTFSGDNAIEEALTALGEQLASQGVRAAIVVVGGATLNVLKIVSRSTSDVDVIAQAHPAGSGKWHLIQAEPFPEPLQVAIRTVARDLGLADDWMNAAVGSQWAHGLPPGIQDDIVWRTYGALDVGFVGRRTLIALKLFAAVDLGPGSVHMHDLLQLAPTDDELHEAGRWVETQDALPTFPTQVREAIAYVQRARTGDR